MKKLLLTVNIVSLFFYLNGQNYQIGHRQVTYTDPSRNNRSILTEVYYPATTAGNNVPVANGQFPVLVFGHGFLMGWDSYKNFWDTLVPMGYIMVFPRTEGSISPSHNEFGLDLRFLNEKIKSENNNSASFLYQHVANTSAIMGHSMGGGCTFIAGENYTNVTTIVNFAAAVTNNPSSITTAAGVTVPLLMFCGENDGATPPSDHQIPMYEACASNCKTLITIKGGGHCYFANYNFNCSLGEATTSPQPTITREEQQAHVMYLLKPYLNYMLKNDAAQGTLFLSRLYNNANITYVRNCNTSINDNSYFDILVFPNPTSDKFNVYLDNNYIGSQIIIRDIIGNIIYSGTISNTEEKINMENYSDGVYILTINKGLEQKNFKIIKNKF